MVFNDEGSLVGATIEQSAPKLENQSVVSNINIAAVGKPCKTESHQSPNAHEIFMDSCCKQPKISTKTE